MGDQGGQVHDFDRCPLTQTFPTSWEFRLLWLFYLHNALCSNAVALTTITIYYVSWFLGVRDSDRSSGDGFSLPHDARASAVRLEGWGQKQLKLLPSQVCWWRQRLCGPESLVASRGGLSFLTTRRAGPQDKPRGRAMGKPGCLFWPRRGVTEHHFCHMHHGSYTGLPGSRPREGKGPSLKGAVWARPDGGHSP